MRLIYLLSFFIIGISGAFQNLSAQKVVLLNDGNTIHTYEENGYYTRIELDQNNDTVYYGKNKAGFSFGRRLVYRKASKTTYIYHFYKDQRNGPVYVIDSLKDTTLIEHYRVFGDGSYKHGYFRYLWPSGIVKTERNYHKGEFHGSLKSYHSNGKLHYAGIYKNGGRIGEHVRFYENGKLKDRYNYSSRTIKGRFYKNLLHGKQQIFYENGVLKSEYYFDHGLGTGDEKRWDKNGELTYLSLMENDSTRKHYYFTKNKVDDSLTTKFWKPFLNPLFINDNSLIGLSNTGAYFKRIYLNLDGKGNYEEQFSSNGALVEQNNQKTHSYISYYDNGKFRSKTRDFYSNYLKQVYFQNGELKEYKAKKFIDKVGYIANYNFYQHSKIPNYANISLIGKGFTYELTLRKELLSKERFEAIINVYENYDNSGLTNRFGTYSSSIIPKRKHIKHKYKLKAVEHSKHIRKIGKKSYLSDAKINSSIFYDLKDGTYETYYLNGALKAKFNLKDTLLEGNFTFQLPNGNFLLHSYNSIGPNPETATVFKRLGYSINKQDTVSSVTSFTPKGDTIYSESLINGVNIYQYSRRRKRRFVRTVKDKHSSIQIYNQYYGSGKLEERSIIGSDEKQVYFRKGSLKEEICRLNNGEWRVKTFYFRNGNLKQQVNENLISGSELTDYLYFYRNGKLKTVKSIRLDKPQYDYKKNGDILGIGTYSYLNGNQYYKREQKNKTVEFINDKRQYKSINTIKKAGKKTYYSGRKLGTKIYYYSKKTISRGWNKIKKLFKCKNENNL